MRLAAAAFPLTALTPAAWEARVLAAVRQAADAGAELVLLPEYATAGLLAHDPRWESWTGLWERTIRDAAVRHGIVVAGGTHLVTTPGGQRNRCLVAFPDGGVQHQDKLHPTPWERGWGLASTSELNLLRIAGACCAVLTCYDVEFPEACRRAAEAGAEVLLVPSWTDDRHGFLRVRTCAAARCIENAVACVHAPLLGGLDRPDGFEQACGAAGVLTPCDAGFPPDGIAADGGWNQAVVVVGDIDLARLRALRAAGTVSPFADRRVAGKYRVRP